MYIYWRIQQDLNCLGKIIQFHDPAMIRQLKRWIKKNYSGIVRAEGMNHGWTNPPNIN